MKKKQFWFKVDNAGKVFPATSNYERPNVFRLSMTLYENIDVDLLQQALNFTLPLFEAFSVQLKNGFFWQYFAENHQVLKVEEESALICKYFKPHHNKGYLFKVYYFQKRITLETFHALTDGYGAMQFLKSLVFEYLVLKGNALEADPTILSRSVQDQRLIEDAFVTNYHRPSLKKMTERHAFHVDGEHFKHRFMHIMKLSMPLNELKTLVKTKYDVTITQYFSAIIMKALILEYIDFKQQKKPLKLFIPVNLRPLFNTQTLRNFSLYIKTVLEPNDHQLSLNDMIKMAKLQFQEQLNKETMQAIMTGYVHFEKAVWIRVLPLFLKTLAFKIGYDILGTKINTTSFSNLGKVELPSSMTPYVEDVDFMIAGYAIGFSSVTYEAQFHLTMTSQIKDTETMHHIIELLQADGLNVALESNYKEDYDGLL
jgi:NRPS condensation-like uncharacterized protein